MNKRIKELLEEAGVKYIVMPSPATAYEKFAELIVRECHALVDYENKQFIKAQFKEHFGVEE